LNQFHGRDAGCFHEIDKLISYTESEQVCEFYVTVPLGITHSKQLPPLAGPSKNEYKRILCEIKFTD